MSIKLTYIEINLIKVDELLDNLLKFSVTL
jgi:hypothetical protein